MVTLVLESLFFSELGGGVRNDDSNHEALVQRQPSHHIHHRPIRSTLWITHYHKDFAVENDATISDAVVNIGRRALIAHC
jgi:hypothetical protein